MPWKNGLGFTDQIGIGPSEAKFPTDRFVWRLSTATVSDPGPFSVFPHCDRWLTVVDGNGLTLNDRPLYYGDCVRFAGDAAIECKPIDGPVLDLGIVFDKRLIEVDMNFAKFGRGACALNTASADLCLIYVCRGKVSSGVITIQKGETLSFKPDAVTKLNCLEASEFVFLKLSGQFERRH